MPFGKELAQLRNKWEDLNKKHNILPFDRNKPPASPQQYQAHQGQPQWQQPGHTDQGGYSRLSEPPSVPYNRPVETSQAPPVPLHTRPSQYGPPNGQGNTVYWRANFSPDTPVSVEFEHKQGHGDNGWGNNELENYTSNPENSFYTPDGKLCVRAISHNEAPNPDSRYTSARLVSRQTLARPKGCLTAHLIMPCAEGIWPAFWLLPCEPFEWPYEGEIDIAESWNGDCQNHSCLHWGFYNGEDYEKHLVQTTHVPDMGRQPVRFDLVWDCEGTGLRGDGKSNGGGRLMWYIDTRPVMKNLMPAGTRPIEDWVILLNVAMGGNVCQGKVPRDGAYDLVVQGLQMSGEPEGGWSRFDADWHNCQDGRIM